MPFSCLTAAHPTPSLLPSLVIRHLHICVHRNIAPVSSAQRVGCEFSTCTVRTYWLCGVKTKQRFWRIYTNTTAPRFCLLAIKSVWVVRWGTGATNSPHHSSAHQSATFLDFSSETRLVCPSWEQVAVFAAPIVLHVWRQDNLFGERIVCLNHGRICQLLDWPVHNVTMADTLQTRGLPHHWSRIKTDTKDGRIFYSHPFERYQSATSLGLPRQPQNMEPWNRRYSFERHQLFSLWSFTSLWTTLSAAAVGRHNKVNHLLQFDQY